MRLFCLPYAGGSAAVYRAWGTALEPRFPVVSVELPGHGRRMREPILRSATALVDVLMSELADELRAGPFALFGHSMGALLAFQLAHELIRRGHPPPARLFLSAARPPGGAGQGGLHKLPDAELLVELDRLGGAPQEALGHPDLMEIMLPIVRADLQLAETWSFAPEEALEIPVALLGGLKDPLAPPDEIERWRPFFAGQVERRVYPGEHFYLLRETEALLRDLREALSEALQSQTRSMVD